MKVSTVSGIKKDPRKKYKFLSRAEYDNIWRLHKRGTYSQKQIGELVGRSAGAVCTALKTRPEDFVDRTPMQDRMAGKVELKEVRQEDFSKLPDTVLFKHSNTYTF